MDQLMIDFGSVIPKEGNEVLFFGKKDKNKISVEKIAEKINTTTYVLLTAIKGRTERILV
jgi:alanine racemase